MIEIHNTIRDIILKYIANPENVVITNQTNLIKDVGLDSISLMMLVVMIEEKFNVEIPDDFLTEENLSNLGNMVSLVETLWKNKNELT